MPADLWLWPRQHTMVGVCGKASFLPYRTKSDQGALVPSAHTSGAWRLPNSSVLRQSTVNALVFEGTFQIQVITGVEENARSLV